MDNAIRTILGGFPVYAVKKRAQAFEEVDAYDRANVLKGVERLRKRLVQHRPSGVPGKRRRQQDDLVLKRTLAFFEGLWAHERNWKLKHVGDAGLGIVLNWRQRKPQNRALCEELGMCAFFGRPYPCSDAAHHSMALTNVNQTRAVFGPWSFMNHACHECQTGIVVGSNFDGIVVLPNVKCNAELTFEYTDVNQDDAECRGRDNKPCVRIEVRQTLQNFKARCGVHGCDRAELIDTANEILCAYTTLLSRTERAVLRRFNALWTTVVETEAALGARFNANVPF